MKKLLLSLASLGLVATSSMSLVACANNNNETEPKTVKKIVEAIDAGPLVGENHPGTYSPKDALDLIKAKLGTIDKKVTFDEAKVNVKQIGTENSTIVNGEITLQILYDGHEMTNTKDNTKNFKFTFITKEYQELGTLVERLNQGVNISLSDFKISIPDLDEAGTIGDFLNLISMFFAPKAMPQSFKDDVNWGKWQTLTNFLPDNIKNKEIKQQISMTTIGTKSDNTILGINTKILDAATMILPDLIHLFNYLTVNNLTENAVLGLIQYLLTSPADIINAEGESDGFMSINPNVKINFSTNLERLLYDLVEGWTTAKGEKPKNEKGEEYKPVDVTIAGIPVKYETIKDKSNNITTLGIADLFGIKDGQENELIKFIDKLFGFDFSTNLDLVLHVNGTFAGEEVKDLIIKNINLGTLIEPALKQTLELDPNLKGTLKKYNFKWTKGKIKVEYQKSDSNDWTIATKVTDLMTAKNLRVKFVNNTWNIKHSGIEKEFELNSGKNDITIDLATKMTPTFEK